jgi:hypothetical protein
MTLAKARSKASANAKHIYNTGVNYNRHLRSSKYFYSTGHWCTLFDLVTETIILRIGTAKCNAMALHVIGHLTWA